MILVKTFYAQNELRNYSYLITDNKTGESWVIDPFDSNPIIDYVKKNHLELKGVLNTHQHWDHVRGNASLEENFRVPICHLKNHQKLRLNQRSSLNVLDTPGHTMDHQVFIREEENTPIALFSGDTLFNAGVGNCRGGGDVDSLYRTTKMLMSNLPEETLLYPGHDYRKRNLEFALAVEPENNKIKENLRSLKDVRTEDLPPVTLGQEMLVNPFFRLNSEEISEKILPDSKKDERELFLKLRQLRDQW